MMGLPALIYRGVASSHSPERSRHPAEPGGTACVTPGRRCPTDRCPLPPDVGGQPWTPPVTSSAGRTADDIALDLVELSLQPEQLREDADSDR